MAKVLQFPRKRRVYDRVAVSQPVALVHDNASVATGMIRNVSRGGLQVLCDRYTVDSLYESDRRPLRRRDVRMDAHFKLPLSYGLVKLDFACRLAYVVAHDDGYLLGLEFVYAPRECFEKLARFLDESRVLAT